MNANSFNAGEMLQAFARLQPKSPGGGRVIMFTSGRRGEGVTPIVHATATAAPGEVFALDLDLRRNQLARSFGPGQLLKGAAGDFGGVLFFSVLDAAGEEIAEPGGAFCYRRAGRSRVQVGVFEPRVVPSRGKVRIATGAHYWDAARARGATLIIDAPALERSRIGLSVAAHADGVVMVVGADQGAAPAAIAARRALDGAGAHIVGIVYSGASAPVLALERLFGR